jgi:ribosomal protein S18 acetylase RimI-like enzyme
MIPHTVRPASEHDASAVRSVVSAAYAHYIQRLGKPPGPMLDDYEQRVADHQVWVLEDADRIAGIIVLETGPDALLLDNIAVLPDCQGKGIGRALIEFAEAEALRRGYAAIRLYTHVLMTENIALYQRIGFVETHRISEKGYDRVYMTKPLHRYRRT